MPPALSLDEVERIAALAHLELTDDEKQLFARQLADILEYANQVQQIDTDGVPATSHVHAQAGLGPVLSGVDAPILPSVEGRDDEVCVSLPIQEAIANAPAAERQAGLFKVPRVIGG